MKYLKDLIWITELGLSVATPLALFLLAAVWLQNRFGLGGWIIILGLFLGLYSAFSSARTFARFYSSKKSKKEDEPPVTFREHD